MADPHNPYAAPREEARPKGRDWVAKRDRDDQIVLADFGRRLGGAILDGLFQSIAAFLGGAVLGLARTGGGSMFARLPGGLPEATVARIATVAVLVAQGALIALRGQSVGKLLVGTRIVRANGRSAGLLRGFVLRTLPITAVLWLPSFAAMMEMRPDVVSALQSLAGVLWLLDSVMVFGRHRQCVHDKIADTYVAIAAKEPVEAAPDSTQAPAKKVSSKRRRRPDRAS